jgi:GMP synthase-like glutamine amidotransferase
VTTGCSAYDADEWIQAFKRFIVRLDAESSAVLLGICFGHQIIAEALGGKVSKNPKGWEARPILLLPDADNDSGGMDTRKPY